VLHMFVDKRYPLSVNLIERMLEHQLEICRDTVGNELTTAVQLIVFLKKQISDSRRPKVHNWKRIFKKKSKKKAKSKQFQAREGKDQVKSKSKVIRMKILQLEGLKLPSLKLGPNCILPPKSLLSHPKTQLQLCEMCSIRGIGMGEKCRSATNGVVLRLEKVSWHRTLDLPEELNDVHDTFYVSNLKKCLAYPTIKVSLDEIRVDAKLNFVEEPMEIWEREFKKLKRSRIAIVKIIWIGWYPTQFFEIYWIGWVRLPSICVLFDKREGTEGEECGTPTQVKSERGQLLVIDSRLRSIPCGISFEVFLACCFDYSFGCYGIIMELWSPVWHWNNWKRFRFLLQFVWTSLDLFRLMSS
ncbi:hypothetical protein Tco_1292127, partial [Tanacetum coccineum]